MPAIDDVTVDEGSELTFTAVGSDTDDPAQNLSYSLTGDVPAGATIDPVTGVFSFTPSETQGGSNFTFSVVVSDGVATGTEELTVTVGEVNDAPVLAPIADASVVEGDTLSLFALGSDSDLPAQNLIYSLTGDNADLASIDSATGEFTFTALELQGGQSFAFTVEVTDGALTTSTSFDVTVIEEGAAPVLTAIGPQSVNELEALIPIELLASDADGDSLTFSLSGAPDGLTINGDNQIVWTPSEEQGPGVFNVLVTVTDSTGLSDNELVTFTVGEVNVAPVLDAIGNQTVNEGEVFTFTATASDADIPANSLSFSLAGGSVPAGAAIDPVSGVFTWTPGETQDGDHTFDVVVSDGELSDTETIMIKVGEVNQAPVVAPVATTSLDELTTSMVQVTASDADIIGGVADELSYSLSESAPDFATIDATGLISFDPSEADGPGTFTFDVAVSDGDATTTVPVTVVVNEVNVAPTLAPIEDATVNEGDALMFTAVGSDLDDPAQNLSYSLTGDVPAGATIDSTTGDFSFTPSETQGGESFTFSVVVSDGVATGTETLTVTVGEVNEAPVADDATFSVDENSAVGTVVGTVTSSDVDGQAPIYTIAAGNDGGEFAIDSDTGEITVFDTLDFETTPSFTLTVNVSDGSDSDNATVVINVIDVNEAPIAPAVTATFTEDDLPGSVSLLDGASDDDGDILSVTNLAFQSGDTSGITINGTSLAVDPVAYNNLAAGDSEVIVYTFNVTDNNGGVVASSATITITGANDEAIAVPDSATTDEDTSVAINVLGNDSDPDAGESPGIDSFVGISAEGGTVTESGGILTYTPAENFDGTDSFTYTLVGGASATVTITVTPVNDAPVAEDATFSIDENTDSGTVVGTVTSSDVDGPAPTYSIVNGNFGDAFAIDPNTGEITVAGSLDFETLSSYLLTINVSDGDLSDTSQVAINIGDVNEVGPTVTDVFVRSTGWASNFLDFIDGGFGDPSDLGFNVSTEVLDEDGNPTGSTNQGDVLPWINLNQLVLVFDSNVSGSLGVEDFVVTGVSGNNADGSTGAIPNVIGVDFDSSGTIATLTFSQSLQSAAVTIRVIADGVSDDAGNVLDGEWMNDISTVSGDGTAGGDFSFRVNALPGDFDQSGLVDVADQTAVTDLNSERLVASFIATGDYTIFGDLNGDGFINSSDADAVLNRLTASLPNSSASQSRSFSAAAQFPAPVFGGR